MTADIELLPLPSVLLNWPHPTNHVAIRDYARANMEPLQAEIEALRAEVERLQRQLRQAHKDYGCELRDPNGTIWEYAAMQRDRAERLAEALRHQRWCRTCAEDGWEICEEGRKNDALLRDQEEGK